MILTIAFKILSCSIRPILYTALITLVVLVLLVFTMPVAFTACSPNSCWCHIAYFFTNSGGPIGFIVLLLVTGIGYASTARGKKEKVSVFLKSIITLLAFFGALAFVNEHFTKHLLKAKRPSHLYMLSQTGLDQTIDSLYNLNKEERQKYFADLVQNHPLQFEQIDQEIQKHWIAEAGFSFPSGHTFNAFLFAMILSYAIYFNRSRPQLRKLFFIPFAWALTVGVSRVAMGAHSAFDVSAGAGLGIVLGALFLYIDLTRHWLTRKN